MGNVLTASQPQELLPLQLYLKDYAFDNTIDSLGSTRFMKVARAANSAGCQVWKVFISPDDSVNLGIYKTEFDRIAYKCLNLQNCSPFRNIPKYDDSSKCVIICRPYHKLTLTDRLTTRPFVVPIERIWYIYQLLSALRQCHSVGVCHGDLKSQNVLLSSSGWLHITDFAFFKPTLLPEDDPSIYSYFFDTSRRQTCYIAPERILAPIEYGTKGQLTSTKLISEGLTPAMDIFSAGCVIYELLSDGHPPFTYGALFKYRKMSSEECAKAVDELLSKINCGTFGPLLRRMLSKNPKDRPSAENILTENANLFPEMITYLYNYINIFRPKDPLRSSADDLLSNVMEADDVIAKLLHDKDTILTRLSSSKVPADSAVFFISLITSNLRAIRTASVRISAMRLVVALSRYASASIALRRVLPYLVSQVDEPSHVDDSRRKDAHLPSSAVQSFAVESIAHLVSKLKPETFEDSLVFTEYLFPKFNGMLDRIALPVLLSLAKYLGRLGETALEFSRVRRDQRWNREEDEAQADSDSDDRRQLCNAMSNLFISLHSKENEVKLVLVRPSSLKRLYTFFEALGSPELLFSHMVTMLNENRDWHVRVAFYESLPMTVKRRDLAASGLAPLLQQGLRDGEELVVSRVLSSIRLLSISSVLPLLQHEKLFKDIVPFLVHPNESIVGETVELIVSLDSMLSLADIHSRVLPEIQPYLKHQLLRLNNKLVVMESLIPPIPRELWKETTSQDEKQCAVFFAYLRGQNNGSSIIFRDLMGESVVREKMKKMQSIVEGMIQQREKNKPKRREEGLYDERRWVDVKEVDKKECSLIASTKDSFAASAHNPLQMSVCDARIEELLGFKKREREARSHSGGRGGGGTREGEKRAIEKMNGVLLMHLHEHSKAITQLAVSEEGSHFASASSDGSFKIWSCDHLRGESYGAVRSETTYSFDRQRDDKKWPLSGIGWAGDTQLVAASTSGELFWADLSTDVKEISRVCLPTEDGPIEQIITHANLTFLRTHHGVFYCYDSRVGKTSSSSSSGKHFIWKKRASNQQAKITSFCIDPNEANWMVTTGTSNLLHVWDMRLRVEVTQFKFGPRGMPIHAWASPYMTNTMREPKILVANSICGEVSVFNVASGMRSEVFWPSHQRKPLFYENSQSTDLNRSVSALCTEKGGWVVMGDTKGEIRKWNINEAGRSAHVSGLSQYQSPSTVRYVSQMSSEGQVLVTYEELEQRRHKDTGVKMGVTDFHRTSITDISILPTGTILSAGSDGCIKVWS